MRLAILFGGASYEHEISIVSAITLKEKLKSFELTFIFCDQDHTFYLIDAALMKAKTFSTGAYKKMVELSLEVGGFFQKKLFSKAVHNMTVLNLIHGADGEDGTIASLLEYYKINFVGPRTAASVYSYNKLFTKYLASSLNIHTLEYEILNINGPRNITFDFPVIVKPLSLGSSIGVSVVKDNAAFEYALDVAYEYDENVLVEPFIEGVKEYNLAGYCLGEKNVFSVVEEPQKQEFLDFDKKYLDFSRSEKVQEAYLNESAEQELKNAFVKIYKNLFEGALIRCDFFMIDNNVYLNEINPIPGSLANYLFEDFEESLTELIKNLPQKKEIRIAYNYLDSIRQSKGK